MSPRQSLSRRQVLGTAAAATLACSHSINAAAIPSQAATSNVSDEFTITHQKIRQSVMGWCFNSMPTGELIQHCAQIGLEAIEGINPTFYPEAKKHGLQISLTGSHSFGNGPTSRENHAACINALRQGIDRAVEYGAPSVITFTGMQVPGMTDAVAEQNCIDCWQQVIGYAEQRKITIVLEHLNSRDDSHPMKGHPGYFGDDVERCIDLVKRMDSPHFKLLFDVYHVQVMNGDVIRRIREFHPWIGHYHTAGNPGRCELDDHQEINYPAVMRAILATGYDHFVAQEFIPTWSDPVQSLRHAAMVCDVKAG